MWTVGPIEWWMGLDINGPIYIETNDGRVSGSLMPDPI